MIIINDRKYWMSDCIMGVEYLIDGGDKCFISVFHYLGQSNHF